MFSQPSPYAPHVLGVTRIMVGLLFLAHGNGKLLGFPAMPSVPPLTSMSGIAGFFELIGGTLIVLGLFTRPVGFILSGVMAVAYFYAHAPRGFDPLLNGGDAAILYCFIFLYFAAAGGGAFSLDRLFGRSSASSSSRTQAA